MTDKQRSFLLRLWLKSDEASDAESANQQRWLASLQEVPDGKRIGFADMLELLTFFEALTQPEQAESDNEDE